MYVENLSESAIAKQCDENSAAIKALSKAIEEILPIIPTQLATVAITGDYDDLIDKPVIPVVPELAPVATSGDYDDLLNKPVIPVVPELAAVATSGDYDDLVDKPLLATVATTGDYDDLLNKPVIPVVPTLAAVATSGDYEDLANKPSIPSISGLAEDDLGNVVLPLADAGKYLKIAADGSIEYDTPSGGGGLSITEVPYNQVESQLAVNDIVLVKVPARAAGISKKYANDADWTKPITLTATYNLGVWCTEFYALGVVTGSNANGLTIKFTAPYTYTALHTTSEVLVVASYMITGLSMLKNNDVFPSGNACVFCGGGAQSTGLSSSASYVDYKYYKIGSIPASS